MRFYKTKPRKELFPPKLGQHTTDILSSLSKYFFFNHPPTTKIYTTSHTLSLHDALPISENAQADPEGRHRREPRCDSLRAGPRSEEHTSELQSRELISYAVFCLKKK